MSSRKRRWAVLVSTGVALILAAFAHAQGADSEGYYNPHKVPVDTKNVIHSVAITKEGRYAGYRKVTIPPEDITQTEFERARKYDSRQPAAPQKISPVLREWRRTRPPSAKVDIIIRLEDGQTRIPLMPRPAAGVDRRISVERRSEIIQPIADQRRTLQQQFVAQFPSLTILQHFWLVNAVAVSAPLADINQLAESDEVLYIQPVEGGEQPPQGSPVPHDGNQNNDVEDGRRLINSDPYFNLSLSQSSIGLLDTGVREDHELFTNPDHIATIGDCVNGGSSCLNSSDPNFNPADTQSHGTVSAGIITANGGFDDAFRGVAEVQLDSWKVYDGALNATAAVWAFQEGVRWSNQVLVAQMQAHESDTGAIAGAADGAYDSGAIVVAANGNSRGSETVRSPAIAHKVIGVGAFSAEFETTLSNLSRGPAPDGRYKPDLLAPSQTESASSASTRALRVMGSTSGATPYAGAVAMLQRNWLSHFGTYDNGQTYAFMILFGQNAFPYNNTVGVGKLRMPTNCEVAWGKLVVTNGQNYDLEIPVGYGWKTFDAALWWPESVFQDHSDIDLHIIDPDGTERGYGYADVSVFERARVAGGLETGTWTLQVHGYQVHSAYQVVYWAAAILR